MKNRLHCKKGELFSRPLAGMSLTNLFLAGNILIIPRQGEFGYDIPAGDGKIANFFLQCTILKPLILSVTAWNA
jgi:hypothetical protein